MGEKTKIPWCHHTFNPYWGCVKVSVGCDNCYAERLAVRYGFKLWGPGAPRRTFSKKHWAEPLKWNAEAEKAGERRRVFCGSMCDVFEARADLDGALADLLMLIHQTPQLDWLLLTKRPELFEARMAAVSAHCDQAGALADQWRYGAAMPNIWMLTTVEDQEALIPRVDALRKIPARVRGLSIEPLLGPLKLCNCHADITPVGWHTPDCPLYIGGGVLDNPRNLDWIIIGCESGPRRRRCEQTWVRKLVAEVRKVGMDVFVKQLEVNGRVEANPRKWPEDLRVQEFPR